MKRDRDKQHASLYIPADNAKGIIIFIHGIMEGPTQFKHLMEIGHKAGYAATSLLLPGHGGSGKDFAQSNKQEWLEHVCHYVNTCQAVYSQIILVGHSMGTLLSLLAYGLNSKAIVGIVAIASPLKVRVQWQAIRNIIKAGLCKNLSPDDPAMATFKASSVSPCNPIRYITWIPRLIDLFQLISRTREMLSQVSIPILIVHAGKDELVSPASVNIFIKEIHQQYRQIIYLPHSTHFIYEMNDQKTLDHAFIAFLEKINILSMSGK